MKQKYYGTIKKGDGTEIPFEEVVILRMQDNAIVPALNGYYYSCMNLGASKEHLNGVEDLINRVMEWRANNRGKTKTPDTVPTDYLPEPGPRPGFSGKPVE